jgi:hypothetical protein
MFASTRGEQVRYEMPVDLLLSQAERAVGIAADACRVAGWEPVLCRIKFADAGRRHTIWRLCRVPAAVGAKRRGRASLR